MATAPLLARAGRFRERRLRPLPLRGDGLPGAAMLKLVVTFLNNLLLTVTRAASGLVESRRSDALLELLARERPAAFAIVALPLPVLRGPSRRLRGESRLSVRFGRFSKADFTTSSSTQSAR
jgi:hypothetical protein